ncbi:MAG: hypothetical protein ACQEP1_06495 [Nanobdellota archaeon]
MRRKAQTATEYMLILAIVIIIALIVAGILGQFPVMGGSAQNRGSAAYWKSAEIGIVSHSISMSEENGVYIEFQNNRANDIEITNVKIGEEEILDVSESLTLNTGESKSETGGNGSALCSAPGDSYTESVSIEYKDLNSENTFVFDGKGNRLEGTCAQQ